MMLVFARALELAQAGDSEAAVQLLVHELGWSEGAARQELKIAMSEDLGELVGGV